LNRFERLRNSIRSLAKGDTQQNTKSRFKPQTNAEVGVAGDFTAQYDAAEARQDTLSIADYRKMLDNDGTVEAIYNMLTWPIKAAGYHFDVEDGGDAELKLVEDNFTLPPHKGGMSLPFDLFIADQVRAIAEGFRLYEKVWTLQDGHFVYKKLAPRDSTTVTLLRDANGGFAGAKQKTWSGLTYVDVTIPIERCYLFTYAKERSFLYGRSAFKSAHYHYDRKHKLYYLQQLGAETGAVPPRKLGVPASVANNPSKLAEAEAAADAFGAMQRITLPEGYTLEEYKTNPQKLTDDINHHDALIARSVLAQFVINGSQGTGSYAMDESQHGNFIQALEGTMKQIEHHINAYLIPDLIIFNFGSGRYPEFHFEDINDRTKVILSAAFNEIIKRPDVPGYVIEGIAAQVAAELGIETDTSKTKSTVKANADAPGARSLSTAGYFRQLTEAEKRVNLSDLVRKTATGEERLTKDAQAFYAALKDDTISRLTKLLAKGDLAAVKSFTLGSFTPYRKVLETGMMEQYLYGKRTAADEIGGKIPQTPSKSRTYITSQAQAVADKQENDLTFAVKNEVATELRRQNLSDSRDLGVADVMARIAGLFLSIAETSVPKGIAASLAGSLNLGRGDSFAADDGIDRMQYSAVLDERTTAMCGDLDGSVVSYEEYAATKWIPPCHWGCRSIWVAIMKDDDFKPDFKPIPAAPGGFSEPQL
jgi:hypothetical protein